jgi:hypothetical protein
VFRRVRAAAIRVAAIVAVILVIGRAAPVRADNFELLRQQLENDDSDKVRLSAAVNLTKLGDPRAIKPLINALANDTDKTVRGAAAVGLGKLVTDKIADGVKKDAVAALTQAKDSDASSVVRREADNALKAIGVVGGPPGKAAPIYVNIGPMASTTGNSAADAKLKALMVSIASQTVTKNRMAITWPGGVPSKATLSASRTAGFFIDGTVNKVEVKETGSSMMVSCKISMLLADFPDKSVFGVLKGGGSVPTSGAKAEVARAGEDCVSAVVEDLIAKQVVPTINSKVGSP